MRVGQRGHVKESKLELQPNTECAKANETEILTVTKNERGEIEIPMSPTQIWSSREQETDDFVFPPDAIDDNVSFGIPSLDSQISSHFHLCHKLVMCVLRCILQQDGSRLC
jgi:hypothetical protein